MDPWTITPAERARHFEQFKSLNSTDGFVTGEQAKGFLLQSQLPPPILGQIWALADMNCDGKMDINEFSVACKLITNKLKGFEVPPTLPPSLKQVLSGTGTPLMSPSISSQQLNSSMRVSPSIPQIIPQQMPLLQQQQIPIMQQQQMPIMQQQMPIMQQQMPIMQQQQQIPPVVPMPITNQAPYYQSQIPTAVPPATLPLSYDLTGMAPGVAQVVLPQQRSMSVTSQDSVVSPLMEWGVPTSSRLKYTQMFNQNDRSKCGYLSGAQARNILLGTGLPQGTLATIWALSDLDSDGRLSSEEFILSLHLCDMAKQTGRVPPKLPADLIPPSFRPGGSRKQSIKSIPGSVSVSGHNTGSNTPNVEPEPLLSPGGTSFEDKRKMNYDKGQAELERRRRVLEEQATREREERERKEREEFEKREKARLEAERKKAEEIERALATQREMEERRLAEFQKAEEMKEAARREMERQRKMEMEETKRLELLARRQKEQEEVLRLKGVHHALALELSSLSERVKELSNKITDTRVGVSTVKCEIDGMRGKRDAFMSESASLKVQLKEQNNRMLVAAQEKIRLERLAAESDVKQMTLKSLREKLDAKREELSKKESDAESSVSELDELKSALSLLLTSSLSLYSEWAGKRETVIAMRRKHGAEFDYNAAWGTHPPPPTTTSPPQSTTTSNVMGRGGSEEGGGGGVVYYRALYDFESRNPDELEFSVGAIIQRDDSVVPDPGWLAGTLDGRAGWFPESFVEVIGTDEQIESYETPHDQIVTQGSVDSQNYASNAPADGDYYIALYAYESHEPGDLPFEVGETIFVPTGQEGEWWNGSIGSARTGLFPANYVAKCSEVVGTDVGDGGNSSVNNATADDILQPLTNFTNDFPMTAFEMSMAAEGTKTELEPYEEAEIKREICEIAGGTKGAPRSPKASKTRKYEIASILADYSPMGDGQLPLAKGALITVRKKSNSGWWEGELQAKGKKREIGWFPASYVKILGPAGGSRQSSSRTTPIPFDDYIMPSSVAPMFNDFKEEESVSVVGGGVVEEEKMIALYPYTSQNSDELTFVKDDVIRILSKDEPDWWRGQLGSSVGLFPVNYVQPLVSNSTNYRNSMESDISGPFQLIGEIKQEKNASPVVPNPNYSTTNNNDFGPTSWMNNSSEPIDNGGGDIDLSSIKKEERVDEWLVESSGAISSMRQDAINELISTEMSYVQDMENVQKCFIYPLKESGMLTYYEHQKMFVNWGELIDCSSRLLKAFSVRKKTQTITSGNLSNIGDILCQHIPSMKVYIRFCSAQLRSAALIQHKTEAEPEFREFTKKCQTDPRVQNLPLSSFLLKPMQRITRYPLLIKKILEHTPEGHFDRGSLEEALFRAEELCGQVNEGVREKENSDRLEWMQNHINCTGLDERLIFNSLTNLVGTRKFIHHGILKKTKSGKELLGLLFNDFFLLALPNKPFNSAQFSFERNRGLKLKIYRKPIFLNEICVDEEGGVPGSENDFVVSGEGKGTQLYLSASGLTEKRLWIKKINEAKKNFLLLQQQKSKDQKSKKINAVGRLLVTVMEAINLLDLTNKSEQRMSAAGHLAIFFIHAHALVNRDIQGKSDPYCEVSLGSELRVTKVLHDTLNPKWNDSMQFSVKNLREDILCLTVYDKDYFAPDQFLGRTEIPISRIEEEMKDRMTPWIKSFKLLEIESGEITIKLHLQIFDN